MNKQEFARLKLKARNNGIRAARDGVKPSLPDADGLTLDHLEVLLNSMQEGYVSELQRRIKRVP